jgi:hypothetical protein
MPIRDPRATRVISDHPARISSAIVVHLRMWMPLKDTSESRRISPVITLIPSCMYGVKVFETVQETLVGLGPSQNMLRAYHQPWFHLRMKMPLGDSHESRRISHVIKLIPACMYVFRDLQDRSRDTCEESDISPWAMCMPSAMFSLTNADTAGRQSRRVSPPNR